MTYPMTKFERQVDRLIAEENRNPKGLPADVLADMEADICANPDKYPELSKLLREKEEGR